MMQFSATIALGLAPLVVFGGAALLRPAPPVPVKHVQTEGVRMIRMDSQTFRARWTPVNDLAPATVIHEAKGGDHSRENTGKPVDVVARSRPPAVRLAQVGAVVRRASLRPTDVCLRHGMHKQITRGGKSWRCRR
jgi:hypothetical protein